MRSPKCTRNSHTRSVPARQRFPSNLQNDCFGKVVQPKWVGRDPASRDSPVRTGCAPASSARSAATSPRRCSSPTPLRKAGNRRQRRRMRHALREFHRRRMDRPGRGPLLRESFPGGRSDVLCGGAIVGGRCRSRSRCRAPGVRRVGTHVGHRACQHPQQDRRPDRGEPRGSGGRRGEFRVGASDVLLGHLGTDTPFWMSADQYEYWRHTHLTVDVVPGRGSGFFPRSARRGALPDPFPPAHRRGDGLPRRGAATTNQGGSAPLNGAPADCRIRHRRCTDRAAHRMPPR